MPPRQRTHPPRLEYNPPPLRLATNYAPRAPESGNDPTMGYGFRGWNEQSKPLTAAQKTQVMGGVGTQFFAGIIAEHQYGEEEPEEWRNDRRWKTIDRMAHDGQVSAVTNVCVLPLLQATYSLNPGSDAQEDVDLAQAVADNLLHGLQGGWYFFLRKFFRNRFRYGHYLGEKVWTVNPDGSVLLRKIAERPPQTIYRWFPNDDDELDRIMQRVWIQDADGVRGQWKYPIIAAEKLLRSTRNQEANDFRGVSLYRAMWQHYDIKHKLYIIDGIAAERNGMGVPDMEEPPIVRQQSDRDLAAQALEAFRVGETAYMLRPNGYKFTLTGVSGAVRDIMPSIQHHDLLMARSALAHFINLDAYGQILISEESQSLFLMSEEAESNESADDLNLLIREWVDYNYENVERYPTVAITAISGTRDLDALLKGIGNLMTAGVLTYNVDTENAIRDDLDLPALPADASPSGGGAASVDPDSQGQAAQTPGTPTPATPGTTAPQALSFTPAFSSGRLGERAIHLSGTPLRTRRHTTYLSGAYPAEYLARDADGTEWICLARKVQVGGKRVPNPNTDAYGSPPDDAEEMLSRGYTHVLWRLGSDEKHCPQCLYMARQGLMQIADLKIEPGSGGTFCTDNCSCSLEYRKAKSVKVGA